MHALSFVQAEDDSGFLREDPHVEFTGEEGGGRYLDLHQLYLQFINSKSFGKQIEYMEYLACFADFSAVPKSGKLTKQYK